ncbi:MAG: hypothetical protein V1777_04265 [Candidatus Micrarchaeota archaeon]
MANEKPANEKPAKDSTHLFLAAVLGLAGLGLIVSFLLWQNDYGWGLFPGLALVIGAAVLWFQTQKPALDGLLSERRKLLSQIEEAEKRFLNRQLTDDSFQKFKAQKQKELVETESKIAVLTKPQAEPSSADTADVASRDKHKLKELLEKKQLINQTFAIAEQKYLKRELSEAEFSELQEKTNTDLLETDSEIKALTQNPQIKHVQAELERELKRAKFEKHAKRKRRVWAEGEVQDTDEIAEELFDQKAED